MNKTIENREEKLPFTAQPWVIFLMFIFFSPLGLYYMWKHRLYSKAIRQIITSLSLSTLLLLAANMIWGDLEVPQPKESQIERIETPKNN